METDVILLLVFAVFVTALAMGLAVYFFLRTNAGKSGQDTRNDSYLLQKQLEELRRSVDEKLDGSRVSVEKAMNTQWSESSKIIRHVTEQLTKLDETNKQVVGFADQLQNLQDILKNPKQRGTLGEYYLESLLQNVLPPSGYKIQYKFEDGEIVDAVVFLDKNKILPVDSKFSLENYNKLLETSDKEERKRLERAFRQDIVNRIDETAKYIRPRENTMEFAFMFIPSEAIYYDLLVNRVGGRDLIEYAFQKKQVVIVSPTSFMAYLQTVLQGLRSLQIEESAKEIRKQVERLGRHIEAHEDKMQRLGTSLSTSVNHYNSAHKELKKMDKDIFKITDTSAGVEPLEIERPQKDETE